MRNMNKSIANSELILNSDGSIYHLHLLPEDLADTIITVGDPDRVAAVSRHFDKIVLRQQKREFVTHTGYIGTRAISVISTGIGTDNIDIVFNELDALANIDLKTRCVKEQHRPLTFIRLGTSGALQPDLDIDSFLASSMGVGFDTLLNFYNYTPNDTEAALARQFGTLPNGVMPYFAQADADLCALFAQGGAATGMTATCAGFYAPQGRQLRLQAAVPDLLDRLQAFNSEDGNWRFSNLEMETAGMYGLARLLGHRALSLNVILANRAQGRFSPDPKKAVDSLIAWALEIISNTPNLFSHTN